MKLETLTELNTERAARRPVIVVTDTANGEQRLVKAKDIAADPLRVMIISEGLARRLWPADQESVGRTVKLGNGQVFTVIGAS